MFILERTGWSQWLDDGDCWRKSKEAAQLFGSQERAAEKKEQVIANSDFEDDDIRIIEQ